MARAANRSDDKQNGGDGNGPSSVDPISLASEYSIGGTGGDGSPDSDSRGNGGTSGADASPGPRRRGRKPGSRNKAKATTDTLALDGLKSVLFAIHLSLATVINDSDWAIDESEAERLAKAFENVAAQYNVTMDPRTQAWFNLALAAGSIYGPRVVGKWIKSRDEKPATEPAKPAAETKANSGGPLTGSTSLFPDLTPPADGTVTH